MRPSKLRLPLSTEATTRSRAFTSAATSVGQRPAVADARRAAVADQVEAQADRDTSVSPACSRYCGHGLRPGRQARLHPRLHAEAALDRLLGQQSGADHHARVRRVRAARDGRDHDGPVIEALDARLRRGRPTARRAFSRSAIVFASAASNDAAACAERHAVLRPPRPGQARLDRSELDLDPSRRSRPRPRPASGTAPAPSRTPRPARCAARRARSAADSRASSGRSGRPRSSRRTPGTCC